MQQRAGISADPAQQPTGPPGSGHGDLLIWRQRRRRIRRHGRGRRLHVRRGLGGQRPDGAHHRAGGAPGAPFRRGGDAQGRRRRVPGGPPHPLPADHAAGAAPAGGASGGAAGPHAALPERRLRGAVCRVARRPGGAQQRALRRQAPVPGRAVRPAVPADVPVGCAAAAAAAPQPVAAAGGPGAAQHPARSLPLRRVSCVSRQRPQRLPLHLLPCSSGSSQRPQLQFQPKQPSMDTLNCCARHKHGRPRRRQSMAD